MTPDFFTGSAFSMVSLTQGINRFPNMYGRVRELGLFPAKGVAVRSIAIEEYNGVLSLIQTKEPGAPPDQNARGKRKIRSFWVPHVPLEDVILPEEVQGVRAFGSENMMLSQEMKMAEVLQDLRNKHAITLEHLRMGALKGVILDADGSTIYDLYSEFQITPKVVFFNLGTATTNVRTKCLEVKRHMEDKLQGEVMSSVHCLCSPEFYDAFTEHDEVREAFKYFQNRQPLSGDYRSHFEYAGVTFEEYRGVASDAAGSSRRFIAAGEAHFFPLGTMTTFKTYFAPADFNETANTIGIELYAKQEPRKFGRGWDVHTQSNPLPMCHRPELLVRGDVDAS